MMADGFLDWTRRLPAGSGSCRPRSARGRGVAAPGRDMMAGRMGSRLFPCVCVDMDGYDEMWRKWLAMDG